MSVVAVEPTSQTSVPSAPRGIRSLLVHVQPETVARSRLDAAVALAAREGARLIGVVAEDVNWAAVATDAYGLAQSMYGELCEITAHNLQVAQESFRKATSDTVHELICVEANPLRTMCDAAAGVDFIVAGGTTDRSIDPHRSCDPAVLALKSGRPVLVVPPEGGALKAESIIVAWKDTRESRRALSDAMPFLRTARNVVIMASALHGEREAARAGVEKVVARLGSIGIEARAVALEGAPEDVVPNIQAEANVWEADLIVCGAYGHSRFGEWMFGGVTADLLADPRRFLLLSH